MKFAQQQWSSLLSLIESLGSSLNDYDLRKQAGKKILDLLHADQFASFVWDEGSNTFSRPVFLNMSPENLERYITYYQFHDPITAKMQPYRRAVLVNEVMAQQDLVKTEFFNDFLTLDGLYYGINLYVYDDDGANIGDFRIWRSYRRDNFGQSELNALDMIAPHFRNAMRNARRAKLAFPEHRIEEIRRNLLKEFELTAREVEIAMCLIQGMSDLEIQHKMYISMPTVRSHVQHIFCKLNVNSRAKLLSKVLLRKLTI